MKAIGDIECRNVPLFLGFYCWPLLALTLSSAVGLAASSWLIHALCLLPFTQCLALLILPDFFSTKKIDDSSAFFFSLSFIALNFMGFQQSLSWSCCISLSAASHPLV